MPTWEDDEDRAFEGDACFCGDAAAPRRVRVWIEVVGTGMRYLPARLNLCERHTGAPARPSRIESAALEWWRAKQLAKTDPNADPINIRVLRWVDSDPPETAREHLRRCSLRLTLAIKRIATSEPRRRDREEEQQRRERRELARRRIGVERFIDIEDEPCP